MAEDIKDVIVGVRRAQRLLQSYHRRLLDMLILLQNEVTEKHDELEFRSWSLAEWSGKPGAQRWDPTKHWAWDAFPMANFYLDWATNKTPRPGQFNLGIRHVIDTGFSRKGLGEPDPTRFEAAERSRTTLLVWVGAVKRRTPKDHDWDDLYDHFEDPEDYEVTTQAVGAGTASYGKFLLDVHELPDVGAVHAKLIRPTLTLIEQALASGPEATGGDGA